MEYDFIAAFIDRWCIQQTETLPAAALPAPVRVHPKSIASRIFEPLGTSMTLRYQLVELLLLFPLEQALKKSEASQAAADRHSLVTSSR
jgi:hypothetical protein